MAKNELKRSPEMDPLDNLEEVTAQLVLQLGVLMPTLWQTNPAAHAKLSLSLQEIIETRDTIAPWEADAVLTQAKTKKGAEDLECILAQGLGGWAKGWKPDKMDAKGLAALIEHKLTPCNTYVYKSAEDRGKGVDLIVYEKKHGEPDRLSFIQIKLGAGSSQIHDGRKGKYNAVQIMQLMDEAETKYMNAIKPSKDLQVQHYLYTTWHITAPALKRFADKKVAVLKKDDLWRIWPARIRDFAIFHTPGKGAWMVPSKETNKALDKLTKPVSLP